MTVVVNQTMNRDVSECGSSALFQLMSHRNIYIVEWVHQGVLYWARNPMKKKLIDGRESPIFSVLLEDVGENGGKKKLMEAFDAYWFGLVPEDQARRAPYQPVNANVPPVLVRDGKCACDCGTPCPLGRRGMQERCTMEDLSAAGIPVRLEVAYSPAQSLHERIKQRLIEADKIREAQSELGLLCSFDVAQVRVINENAEGYGVARFLTTWEQDLILKGKEAAIAEKTKKLEALVSPPITITLPDSQPLHSEPKQAKAPSPPESKVGDLTMSQIENIVSRCEEEMANALIQSEEGGEAGPK